MPLNIHGTTARVLASLILLGALVLCSCGAAGIPLDTADAAQQPGRHASENVVLTILPDTYVEGGRADAIDVTERRGNGELLIDISVRGAVNLKALYFHIEFDNARYAPGQLKSRFLLAPEEECLSLLLSTGEGLVEYGELVMLPQEPGRDGREKGYTGDGLLCTFALKERAALGGNRPAGR